MRRILILLLIVELAACDDSRIIDQNADIPNSLWLVDSVKTFQFEIKDAGLSYNLYANITNTIDYPYYNLYYRYRLSDSLDLTLESALLNCILFDAKTGEPRGGGVGDIFDHRAPILKNYQFANPGKYSISLQQYMRTDSLPGIRTVGARVEIAE